MRNFSGINFNYTKRLHFLLVIIAHFNKILIYSKVEPASMVKKKNPQVPNLLNLFCSTGATSNTTAKSKVLQLNTEVIIN